MQLDVGSEPYLSTAIALCLCISHTFYYMHGGIACTLPQNWILVQWLFVQSRTDRRNAMHMSPPCISTGVCKDYDWKCWNDWFHFFLVRPAFITLMIWEWGRRKLRKQNRRSFSRKKLMACTSLHSRVTCTCYGRVRVKCSKWRI